MELGTWNLEPGTWDLEPGTWNLEPGTWNPELKKPGIMIHRGDSALSNQEKAGAEIDVLLACAAGLATDINAASG